MPAARARSVCSGSGRRPGSPGWVGAGCAGPPDWVDLVGLADDGVQREELLRLAGALEDASEHPIAQAVAAAATRDPLEQMRVVADLEDFLDAFSRYRPR